MSKLKYLSTRNVKGGMEKVPFEFFHPIMGVMSSQKDFLINFANAPYTLEDVTKSKLVFSNFELEQNQGIIHFNIEYKIFERGSLCRSSESDEEHKEGIMVPDVIDFVSKMNLETLLPYIDRTLITYDEKLRTNGLAIITYAPLVAGVSSLMNCEYAVISRGFKFGGRYFQDTSVRGFSLSLSYDRYKQMKFEEKIWF